MKKYLLFCLILTTLLLAACGAPAPAPSAPAPSDPSGPVKNYINVNWPHYQTPQALADAATDIVEGKVVGIFFDVLDLSTGKSVSQVTPGPDASLELYTVYQVQVTHRYKGAQEETLYICHIGGLEGYEEAQQKAALQQAHLGDADLGFLNHISPLQVGAGYLFYASDLGGSYRYIINGHQFAYKIDAPDAGDGFSYGQLKESLLNTP